MATGSAALQFALAKANTRKKPKVSQATSSQTSELTIEERLQRLELGQQLHSQAIVQQGHKVNRIAAATETVIWIADPILKQQAAEAHETWKANKPDKGPHPMGSHGHVVHALILQAMAQAVQELTAKPAAQETLKKHTQLPALQKFMNTSKEPALYKAIHTYLTELNNRPMTDCVQSCRPISKRKVPEDKPWGWSVIYEVGSDGSRLKDFMVLHGQPLHEILQLITVRKGIPKEDRTLRRIANMVPGWGGGNAEEAGEEREEDEQEQKQATQQTPMKDAKRGRK